MVTFRDWLRASEGDRELYATTKRALVHQQWKYAQNYADAKSAVIGEISAVVDDIGHCLQLARFAPSTWATVGDGVTALPSAKAAM
jgi:hypothetical protein